MMVSVCERALREAANHIVPRPLIWQQGALTRVEKALPSFPPADFLETGFPPQAARGREGGVLLLPCCQIRALIVPSCLPRPAAFHFGERSATRYSCFLRHGYSEFNSNFLMHNLGIPRRRQQQQQREMRELLFICQSSSPEVIFKKVSSQ